MGNNTAFLMAYETLTRMEFELRKNYIDKKKVQNMLKEFSFILDQYPILINHQIWVDVEKKLILEKTRNLKLGSMAIKLPIYSEGSEILIIDYTQNKSHVRQAKK